MNETPDRADFASPDRTDHKNGSRGLVTIVITVCNRLQYLNRAIESALGQTHCDVQVIVIDDGSSVDPLPAISAYGTRVEFHRKQNGGVSSARNVGIDRSRGEFIVFLDDDDYLEPQAVENLLTAFDENPGAEWAAGRLVYFDDEGNRTPGIASLHFESGDIYPRLIMDNLISCPSSVMVRTETIRMVGKFDESILLNEDYDLWLTLARDHPVAATPYVVTNYRVHSQQNSTTHWSRLYEQHLLVLEKHRRRARPGCEPVFDRAVAQVHFQYGDSLYVSGDTKAARTHWRLSVPGENPWTRRRLVGRFTKSYLPPTMLNALRTVSQAGRSTANG